MKALTLQPLWRVIFELLHIELENFPKTKLSPTFC
nr:MAG TPA: hypothetical protein [Caudoviricetes sp.]